ERMACALPVVHAAAGLPMGAAAAMGGAAGHVTADAAGEALQLLHIGELLAGLLFVAGGAGLTLGFLGDARGGKGFGAGGAAGGGEAGAGGGGAWLYGAPSDFLPFSHG
ncbi:MAG: hypothetical protein AAFW98_00835, partial [Pseudomonadota bacterium]